MRSRARRRWRAGGTGVINAGTAARSGTHRLRRPAPRTRMLPRAAGGAPLAGPRWPPAAPGSSVGKQRHGEALVAAEEDGAGDGVRAVAVADQVERDVERAGAVGLEGQRELDGSRVLEVG